MEGTNFRRLYARNLGPILAAFVIVLSLNVFTPLGFFDELRTILVARGGWKAIVLFLVFVFSLVGLLQYLMQRPIAEALKQYANGNPLKEDLREGARRRLLNLPFILAFLNLGTTGLLPAVMLTFFCYFADLSVRSALFIYFRGIVVAMIAASVSFFLVEAFLRRNIVPILFPGGKLAMVRGAVKASIGVRIRLLYIAGTLIPMTILLGTLFLNLWSPNIQGVSAMQLAREILVFTVILCVIFVVVALRLNSLVVKSVVSIIEEMLGVMSSVKQGDFTKHIRVVSNDELGILGDAENDMIAGLSEREMIRDTFGKYVTPEIRDEILAGRIPLSGRRAEATMLFCDLRNFTPFVEENDPEEVIMSMRAYFTAMQTAIGRYEGLVLQYVGDEIEAVFGVPLAYEDHPDKAVMAALEMRVRLQELNEQRVNQGKSPFKNGIGIHTGGVLAGNTGSYDRLSYALIGNTVNVASRIQGLTKDFGCDLLISEETQKRLRNSFDLEKKGTQLVKGYSKPITLYAVVNSDVSQGN